MPLAPLLGSVRAATTATSHWWPFVMNVFEPLRIQSPEPSSALTAVDLRLARSEPPDGSVMPIDRISSPVATRGRYFCFCSSVPRLTMYGAVTSEWMPKHDATAAVNLLISSAKIALKR